MNLPDDDHLTRSVTELGDPELLFRVGNGRLAAKLAVGVALLMFGIIGNYWWWTSGPGTFGHFELLLLFVVPFSGGALLLHMYRERGLFVLLYPNGLLRLRRGEVDSLPWREVNQVLLKAQRTAAAEIERGPDGGIVACWLPADVPTFQLWTAGMSVMRTDGIVVRLGPALTDYEQLAEEVQKRSFKYLWPSTWNKFLSSGMVMFGELEVSRVGLRHEAKFLPWSDVKELAIAQSKLCVKQTGKWLPWVLLDISAVPNPHVLFALVIEAQRRFLASPPPKIQPEPHAAG